MSLYDLYQVLAIAREAISMPTPPLTLRKPLKTYKYLLKERSGYGFEFMVADLKLACAGETRLFQYKSSVRSGIFHRVVDLETGAASVITQTTYEQLAPLLDDSNKLRIRLGDELPISVLRGLSVTIQK